LRLILGIGNPGNKYKNNRHNVGFIILDHLASLNSLSFSAARGDYYSASGSLEGYEYQLIKPTTYVNNSGLAASQVLEKYNLEVKDLLVIHDDVNLQHSDIRVKARGGDGGHNGLNSLIYHLMSDEFPRIRIGVGNDFDKGDMADYVLSDFSIEEKKALEEKFDTIKTLISEFITGGVSKLLDANSRISNPDKNSENNQKST
jgi:PTH1 family peptidyl-tRNA hydrolase